MNDYSKLSKQEGSRVELHDKLGLTGAEISINTLPEGGSVPFVHAHKTNEEIYYILSGKGKAIINEDEVELNEGDWIRIAPAVMRQFFAGEHDAISYLCIQVKENSLEQYTGDDAVVK